MKIPQATAFKRRALLVGLINPKKTYDSMQELEALSETAGAVPVQTIVQKTDKVNPAFLVGRGKAQEIKQCVKELDVDLVIFDNNLSPAQIKNLEKELEVPVMDRTEIILDIFATHAKTKEAKTQVELARLRYELPRLIGKRSYLEQIQSGAPISAAVGTGQRGPGEKQIEYDRRFIRRRIYELQTKIKQMELRRKRLVESRTTDNYTISIVGYTNAGKSTLMNRLTNAGVYVDDKLFATLDTKTSIWTLTDGTKVLLSDTVGFIHDLPHHLITSFYATLQEVQKSNILLHVVDAANQYIDDQIESVRDVLTEIKCHDKPIILLLNKIDLVKAPIELNILKNKCPNALFISARNGKGIDDLEEKILEELKERTSDTTLKIPVTDGKTISELLGSYAILSRSEEDECVILQARIPKRDLYKFERFVQ